LKINYFEILVTSTLEKNISQWNLLPLDNTLFEDNLALSNLYTLVTSRSMRMKMSNKSEHTDLNLNASAVRCDPLI
jgi:hypothetical protein